MDIITLPFIEALAPMFKIVTNYSTITVVFQPK